MKHLYVIILLCAFSMKSMASVRVAFIEAVSETGRPISLSPGERFYHVAIQTEGLWYESLPKRQVIGRKKLGIHKNMFLSLVVESDEIKISKELVRKYIGWDFDYSYSWTKSGKTYCSRLVANLLGIEPSPMLFMGRHWSKTDLSKVGKLGISPDELLAELKEMGFETIYDRRKGFQKKRKPHGVKSCSSVL